MMRKKYPKGSREYVIADNWQLALKILSNSFYGVLGGVSRFWNIDLPESITRTAKACLLEVEDILNEMGFDILYGDSVAADTKIYLENGIETDIEKIFRNVDFRVGEKEYYFPKNVKVLTLDKNGKTTYKNVRYVMRHKTNKKMYRVWFNNQQYIDITEDHSLMASHSDITDFGKLEPLKPSSEMFDYLFVLLNNEKKIEFFKAVKIEEIKYNGYVYDIEVEDTHTFFANGILAHNTDSVYFLPREKYSLNKLKKEIYEISEELNNKLKEKLIRKYNLNEEFYCINFAPRDIFASAHFFKKKMYLALKVWDEGDLVNQVMVKGLLFKKYNTPEIVKEVQKNICLMSIYRADEKDFIKKVREYLKKIKDDLYKGKLDELLKISQYISDEKEYKVLPPFMKAVNKAKDRGIFLGGVVDYVFVNNNEVELIIDGRIPKINKTTYDYYWHHRIGKVVLDTLGEEFVINNPDLHLLKGGKYNSLKLDEYVGGVDGAVKAVY